jgi:multicomponent Na+:H+ antiporter subunit C
VEGFRRGHIKMWNLIHEHLNDLVAVALFVTGFGDLLFQKNMIKKIIGLNIMDTAVYLLLASQGYIEGRKAPIVVDGVRDAAAYINPIPSGLVLTGIVVSVSVTALLLSLTIRMYRKYHSLDLDYCLMMARHEDKVNS